MNVPAEGRLAGIDYGHVRIGIAVCDPTQRVASPLENYTRGGEDQDRRKFQTLAEQEDLVGWVIGLPIHTDGQESRKSIEAREFGQWLSAATDLPVAYHDERFTSQEAVRHLHSAGLTRKRRKERLDMIAAQIILAAYLESGREERAEPLEG